MHGVGGCASDLLDVSLKGILVARPEKCTIPPAGTHVTLEVCLEGSERTIRMDATVAHASTDAIGFSCRGFDLASVAELRRLVELNLGDEALLERELDALASA